MSEESTEPRRFSRRDLLTKVPIAIVGGVALGVALGRPLASRFIRGRQSLEVPEGSIFTPADDARRT